MAAVSVLEKLINFVYGALIFIILIAVLFAVYHIFWAEKPSIPEQNFDSLFQEISALKKDMDFEVVMRPSEEGYDIYLYPWDNKIAECAGSPCLCLKEIDKALVCRVIPRTRRDCSKGPCVEKEYRRNVLPLISAPVKISNKDNRLSIS